jgi:hypothetical protein
VDQLVRRSSVVRSGIQGQTVGVGKGPGGRRSRPPVRDRELWTEEEVTVVLASCPPDTQNYRPEAQWVRELADLLDRTPGAISMHLGNIFSQKRPGHGLGHLGRTTIRVYQRYLTHRADLQHDAALLRQRYFNRLVSPRVETHVTESEANRLEKELLRRFPEAHLPAGSVILYRYPGSVWFGVLLPVYLVLVYPNEAKVALRIAIDILGAAIRRTRGVEEVLDGQIVELAERQIADRAPKFHSHELSERDRLTLALHLPTLMSLKRWKPTPRRLELYTSVNEATERMRIGAYFHIDTTKLCRRCVMMLLDALDNALATGRM